MTHPTSDSTDRQAGGYENDLREAENAMVAAGHPDIALGMRRHSEAQRNMMQGVLVPMFVEMVERTLGTRIDGLRTDVQAWAQESAARLGKLEDIVVALAERVTLGEVERADLRARVLLVEKGIAALSQIIADRPAQRQIEHQALIAAIRDVHHTHDDGHDGP